MFTSKKLANCFKLSSRLSIYVPQTVNVNEYIDNTKYVNDTLTILSKYFGGATASQAKGSWLTSNGELVIESTTIVFAYCNTRQLEESFDKIHDYIQRLKKEMSQEAIAIELNGEMYFI